MQFTTALIGSLYITALFAVVYVLIRFIIRGVLFLYAAHAGAPYVPTRADIDQILLARPVKKGAQFLEVGCGDGRVISRAVELLAVEGMGIDIDPVLIARAKRSVKHMTHPPHFQVANIHDFSTSNYDVFYLFLLPKLLRTVATKLIAERGNRPILIISHAFQIAALSPHLTHVEPGHPYETYYYQIGSKPSISSSKHAIVNA